MDKEPALLWLLSYGGMVALIAYFAIRWSRWLAVVFAPLAILLLVALTSEIRDSHVGPAILREAGLAYVIGGWIAGMLPAAGCFAGWRMNRRCTQNA